MSPVIVAGCRTPFLRSGTDFKDLLTYETLSVRAPPQFKRIEEDNGIRGDTTAVALLMSYRKAKNLGYTPVARIAGFSFHGCDPDDELLLGPAYAVPKLLRTRQGGLMDFVRLEKHEDGVLFAFMDNPHGPINTLSEPVISEIESVLDEVGTDHFAKALVFISAKEDNFIVGADIRDFDKISEPGHAREILTRVHTLFNRITNLHYP